MEIEQQQDLGAEGPLDDDKYLLEVNLDDLNSSSGEWQEYFSFRLVTNTLNLNYYHLGLGRQRRFGSITQPTIPTDFTTAISIIN